MAAKPHRPMIIISYDDGPVEDYTVAFPVHQRLAVPAEINIVTDLIGTPKFLSQRQIAEMEAAGFEVISHTCGHNTLISVPLVRQADPGDTKLYMQKVRLKNANCRILHYDSTETLHILGRDRDRRGRYAILAAPLRYGYPAGARVRLSDEEVHREVVHSRHKLEEMGLRVQSFTYPYNEWDEDSRRLVAAEYESARGGGNFGLNVWQDIEPFTLHAKNFVHLSKRQIHQLVDNVARTNGLVIFYTHTWEDEFSSDKLEFVIGQAQRRGIQIATRRDVVSRTHERQM